MMLIQISPRESSYKRNGSSPLRPFCDVKTLSGRAIRRSFNERNRRKLKESARCRHPPLLQTILNKQLIPTPGRNYTGRQVNAKIFKASSIEPMNVKRWEH